MADFDPEVLAAAPVVLVLHQDGRAELTVSDAVDDAALAGYFRSTADLIEAGGHRKVCETCAAGVPHDHAEPHPTDLSGE